MLSTTLNLFEKTEDATRYSSIRAGIEGPGRTIKLRKEISVDTSEVNSLMFLPFTLLEAIVVLDKEEKGHPLSSILAECYQALAFGIRDGLIIGSELDSVLTHPSDVRLHFSLDIAKQRITVTLWF